MAVAQYIFTHKQYTEQHNSLGPCPVLTRYTLAFALQLKKERGKTPVRVVKRLDPHNETTKQSQTRSGYMMSAVCPIHTAARKHRHKRDSAPRFQSFDVT